MVFLGVIKHLTMALIMPYFRREKGGIGCGFWCPLIPIDPTKTHPGAPAWWRDEQHPQAWGQISANEKQFGHLLVFVFFHRFLWNQDNSNKSSCKELKFFYYSTDFMVTQVYGDMWVFKRKMQVWEYVNDDISHQIIKIHAINRISW